LNQQEFFALLSEAREDGATIFLSSHILSEVERMCDRVGIIRSGRLVTIADLDELHAIRFHHVELDFAPGTEVPVSVIRSAAGVEEVVASDHKVKCIVKGSFEPLLDALRGATVNNLVSHEPSLEEIFLEYYRETAPAKVMTP
jgi:ABC-2 type transport system ATP-binding protein